MALTIEIIRAATIDKDPQAIEAVLAHYAEYIAQMSTVTGKDKSGMPIEYVDEDMRSKLQLELLEALPRFDFDGMMKGSGNQADSSAENNSV